MLLLELLDLDLELQELELHELEMLELHLLLWQLWPLNWPVFEHRKYHQPGSWGRGPSRGWC